MEDDDTRSTVAPLIPLNGDDWNSSRQLRGALLTFADKTFYAGSGRYKEEVALGTRFVVIGVRAVWKRWEDGRVSDFVQQIDGHYPQRHELGYLDETAWPCGPGGKPADPWQDSREVGLNKQDDYAEFTFCTSSGGGRNSVDALLSSLRSGRLLRPGQLPVIALDWKPMTTRYGMKSRPVLKIVDWWRPDNGTTAIAPPELNDKIPF
jgi:hypothetical protein